MMNKYNLIVNETFMSPGDCSISFQGKASEMAEATRSLSEVLLTTGMGYRYNGNVQDEEEEIVTIEVTRRRK